MPPPGTFRRPLVRTPSPLRIRGKERHNRHDADAERWVVREGEEDPERPEDQEAGPEQQGADSPRKLFSKWLLPFGRSDSYLARRDLDVMSVRHRS